MLLVSSDSSREFLKLGGGRDRKKKKNYYKVLAMVEQTVRERSDIDLLRLRIMFKKHQASGSRLVGFH